MTTWEVIHRPAGLLLRDADGAAIGRVLQQGNDFSFSGATAGEALHLLWAPRHWRDYHIPELSLVAHIDFSTGILIYRALSIREIRFEWMGDAHLIRRLPFGKTECVKGDTPCMWMKSGLTRDRVTIDRVEKALRLPIALLMLAATRFEDGLPG